MGRAAPAGADTVAALWASVRASRAALEAARDDYVNGSASAASLSRATAEADVLSSSAARLVRALAASPLALQDTPPPPAPALDHRAVLAHAVAMTRYLSATRCPACGGATD